MGQTTKIPYVHHTFNPWWGCCPPIPDRAGCLNCYAHAMDHRLRPGGATHWGRDAPRRFFPDAYWARPLEWDRKARAAGQRRRVLCGSMCDWLEDRRGLYASRERLLRLIDCTPDLDWLLLSKRLENFQDLLPAALPPQVPWPKNAWIGATIEHQAELDRTAAVLSDVDAYVWPAVLFISAEPLLGPIDFAPHIELIDWIVAGGESGPGARPMHPDWVRQIRDTARATQTPFYFKQWGEWSPAWSSKHGRPRGLSIVFADGQTVFRNGNRTGRELAGREHLEIPEPSK